jgi:hypothetical protein
MPPHMLIRTPMQTGYGSIIHCWVSLPHVPGLVDNVKYWEPDDVKPPQDDTELRRYRARGPTLRSLVKLALRCQSAEEMGLKLKHRFDRSLRRRGIDPSRERQRQAEAALADQLDRLLAQD